MERFDLSSAVGVLLALSLVLSEKTVLADPRFEARVLTISDLPERFQAACWTFADIRGKGTPDLIIAGLWSQGREWLSGALVIRIEKKDLTVAGTIFERQMHSTPAGAMTPRIGRLSSCDLDNDGRDEVFAVGPASSNEHYMARWNGEVFEQQKAPFPGLYGLILAWLDYDADGWNDLYVAGGKPIEGHPHAVLQVPGTIYHNQKGRLTETEITFGDDVVNSAHVLDFDEDGKPDLLLSGASSCVEHPRFSRLFLNRRDRFQEIELPLRGTDKLIGMDSACVATADLNADGSAELLVAGHWASFVAKSTAALLYTKVRAAQDNGYYLDYDLERMHQIPDINGQFTLADLDGDGDIDILAAGYGRDLKYRVICLSNDDGSFRSVTTGAWAESSDKPLGEGEWLVIPWDVDQDGLLDAVCFPASRGNRPTLLINNSGSKPG